MKKGVSEKGFFKTKKGFMLEKRKVYQYTLLKKGFKFYGKEFMFVIFMKRVFNSTIKC